MGTICGATLAPGIAQAEVMTARPAIEFRDSFGVQLHTSFVGYPGDRTSIDTLQTMLRTLGTWHVRDSVCLDTEAACVRPRARLAQLSDSLGADYPKVDLLLNLTASSRPIRSATFAMTTSPGR